MIEVRCKNYEDGCPFADDNVHEAESLDAFRDHKCPVLANGGQCKAFDAANPPATPRSSPFKKIIGAVAKPQVALAGGGVLLAAGVGAAIYNFVPIFNSCNIEDARNVLELDPKVSELETVGEDCFEDGLDSGDIDKLVTATTALRLAADKGSPKAAFLLGRMFDPNARPELESGAEFAELLPAVDVGEALRFYDLASASNPDAKAAAAALRERFKAYATNAVGKKGGPLDLPEHPGLARRVLAKPGAMLFAEPSDAAPGQPLPPLSIHYVFETKPGWVKVGYQYDGGPAGWVKEDMTEAWNVMLVFAYEPREFRKRAVFFTDDITAKSVISSTDRDAEIDRLLASADGETPDPRLVAVERDAIDPNAARYLMPILKTERVNMEDGRTVYIAKVASASGAAAGPEATSPAATCARAGNRGAVHQIAFAIDTTASMGPYIEGTKTIAKTWVAEVTRRGIADKFRFGLVGYRNNMDDEPQRSGLEYVTSTPLSLSSGATVDAFAAALNQLRPASVSTHAFDEDAVAGLDQALRMDWDQACGTKLLFLVTDAGALTSNDPKARMQGVGLSTIAALAASKGITVFPVHIHTPEARNARNVEKAERQYRADFTDPSGTSPYRSIGDGSAESFKRYLSEIGTMIDRLEKERRDVLISPEEAASVAAKAPSERTMSDLVLGKLFASQQRLLGAQKGASAPTFTASWTSDRDIVNPDVAAFRVEVFLTRRQLGQLAEKCQRLIDNAKTTESSTFFDRLRMVAAATSQDPARFKDADLALDTMMPSFLKLLPYRSKVLTLSQDDWRGMSAAKQKAFVTELVEKVSFYRGLQNDQARWEKLGGSDTGEDVIRVPLDRLP
jgi:serine/threonine-protein kinase PpkA